MARMFKRRFHFGTRRVDHADQTNKDKILFQFIGFDLFRIIRNILFHAIGKPDHAQRIFGHRIVGGQDAFLRFLGHWLRFVVHALILRAKIKHNIRRAFDGDHIPIFMLLIIEWRWIMRLRVAHIMDGDHALAFRIKWHFILARIGFVNFDVDCPSLGSCNQQRTLCRVADDAVGLL